MKRIYTAPPLIVWLYTIILLIAAAGVFGLLFLVSSDPWAIFI